MAVVSALWLTVGTGLTVVHSASVGSVSDLAFVLLMVGGVASIGCGAWRNRPQPAWPWWLLVVAGVMFTVSGAIRASVDATGDLSPDRNLWPDAFALPGYVLFTVGLLALVRSRGGGRRDVDDNLDAAMLAIGCLVLVWVGLLAPVLHGIDGAGRAKLAVSIYPPISAFLVAIAARLAFSPGRRCIAYSLVLIGFGCQMIGDVVYFYVETDILHPPGRLVDLPYAIAFTLIGAGVLHPSVRQVTVPRPKSAAVAMSRGRIALVSAVILLPALLLPLWRPDQAIELWLIGGLVLLLAGAAVSRLAVSVHQQSVLAGRLTFQATHDTLTGLPNRAFLFDHLRALLASGPTGASVTVMFVDIDQFKLVNDSLGHSVGDRMLIQAGLRLCQTVRREDLVARPSGDEYVVVASGLDAEDARALAERIRQAFQAPIDIGIEAFVTVSIGVAISSGDDTAESLLRDADTAMYRAKHIGRDSVVAFDVAMRQELEWRVALEADLRNAIANEQIQVYYQPVVDLTTGRVEGFEALARWQRGEEWISPVDFVWVAEETGLIVPLGELVLRQACMQLAEWRHRFGALTMSVNVSAGQLHTTDIAATVQHALHQSELPGEALWLEITESVMMHDTADTLVVLNRLREHGPRLCMDDFGTGFSSLAYLQRFPIDRFKIDRSFVSDLGPHRPEALVRSMVAIGRELGMDVVAEGIETPEQRERLLALGCRLGQGYLFARPMPAAEVAALLDRTGAILATEPAKEMSTAALETVRGATVIPSGRPGGR
jgi:diguanylate cyclase (GGDEF)-like protein